MDGFARSHLYPPCYLDVSVVVFWMDDPRISPNLPAEIMVLIVFIVWTTAADHPVDGLVFRAGL